MRARCGLLPTWLPLITFIISAGLYLRTLAPTITWQHDGYDAGDLITAAYKLGIPHPTGYPTYMLLGHCFTRLPLGDVAYRMNLLSACCAALTILLVYEASLTLLRAQPYARLASASAALLLATSRIFWSQAVITEVYALNALFFAALLCLVLQSQVQLRSPGGCRQFRLGILALTALTFGLGLGNHLTLVFIAPLLLFVGIAFWRRRVLQPVHWIGVLVLFLLGLSVYAYLPLRAGKEALLNWGNPNTLRGFLWVVSGGIYRQFVLSLPLAHWAERTLSWAKLLVQQFGLWGTALGLLGAWRHVERTPHQFAGLLLTGLIYSVYAIGYNTTDSYVYLLPVYVIYALWVALGAQCIVAALSAVQGKHSAPLSAALTIALFLLPLNSLRINLPAVDLSQDWSAYDYASQAFAQVPDKSIILTATDAHTFTLYYFARVATSRTEVAVIDRDLLGYDWYVDGLRRSYAWLHLPAPSAGGALSAEQLMEANAGSAAIFWADVDAALLSRYHLQREGVLYRWLAR